MRYPFVVHHHIDANMIACLAQLDQKNDWNADVGPCWKANPAFGEKSCWSGHMYSIPPMDNYLYYLPDTNVILCSCEKCGSTSLLAFVYKALFGHRWNYSDAPWVQDVSHRWNLNGKPLLSKIGGKTARKLIKKKGAYGFALVRDPVKRLVSAWKSKLQCEQIGAEGDGQAKVDMDDRGMFVPMMLKLQNRSFRASCLSLNDFARALLNIHNDQHNYYLQTHFLSQRLHCFRDVEPKRWSRVGALGTNSGNSALVELAARLGSNGTMIEQLHRSESKKHKSMDGELMKMLEVVTKKDYLAISESGAVLT